MIVGHGDLAQALKAVDRDDILFFASGVSNSQETDPGEYLRELTLFSEVGLNFKGRVVYFSSLSIFYADTYYVKHKRGMEDAIMRSCPSYTIVRIGNIDWGNNPHTIINFIRSKIKSGEPFEVQDTYRYIVNREEFLHWIKMIPDFNCEMNIPGKMLTIKQIVEQYGKT